MPALLRRRVRSPSTGSTLITSAPRSANVMPVAGPMIMWEISSTRTPLSGRSSGVRYGEGAGLAEEDGLVMVEGEESGRGSTEIVINYSGLIITEKHGCELCAVRACRASDETLMSAAVAPSGGRRIRCKPPRVRVDAQRPPQRREGTLHTVFAVAHLAARTDWHGA